MTKQKEIDACRKVLIAGHQGWRNRVSAYMFLKAMQHYDGFDVIDSELSTEVIEHDNTLWYRLTVTLMDTTCVFNKPIKRNYHKECREVENAIFNGFTL